MNGNFQDFVIPKTVGLTVGQTVTNGDNPCKKCYYNDGIVIHGYKTGEMHPICRLCIPLRFNKFIDKEEKLKNGRIVKIW